MVKNKGKAMKNRNPTVSVIMPAFNAAPYIAAAIESVLQQTYTPIEFIVVDDGSKDDTRRIAQRYPSELVQVFSTENRGQSAACNLGFSKSIGEYIKFFDADDLLAPEHIALQANRLASRPDCIATGEVWRFWQKPAQDSLYEPLANWKDLHPLDWLIADCGKGLGMMQAGLFLFPRQFVEQSGGWAEQLTLLNDLDFCSRVLLQANRVLYCPGARLYYRSGLSHSLSAQHQPKHLQSSFQSLEKTTRLLLTAEDSPRVRSVLARYWKARSFHYYPTSPRLFRRAEVWTDTLGGSNLAPFGGFSGILSRFIGWKTVKWMHLWKNSFSPKTAASHTRNSPSE
jgi:glycosyltransferase involved in cell wall biosynthesis